MGNSLQLAQNLVKIPSVTPVNGVNREGSRACLELVADFVAAHGFQSEIMTYTHNEKGSEYPVDNLFASRRAIEENAPHLCFIGHVDTVSTGNKDEWSFDPFAGDIVDGLVRGRGVRDMKGAVAAFAGACATLPENITVSLLLTAHEEVATRAGVHDALKEIQGRGERIDYFVVGEPASTHQLGDEIATGCAGRIYGTLVSKGVQGHIAAPATFANPYKPLIDAAATLQNVPWQDGGELYPDTRIEILDFPTQRSTERCVIENHACCHIGIVHSPLTTPDEVRTRVQNVVEGKSLKCVEVQDWESLDFYQSEPADLADAARKAVADNLGTSARFGLASFSSDGRFIPLSYPQSQIIEFGPTKKGPDDYHAGCGGMHQVDEVLAVSDIANMQAMYEQVIRTLANQPVPSV